MNWLVVFGVAKSAVSRYLNLTREFPLNRSEDFAKALSISTEYLLGFDKSEQQHEQPHNIVQLILKAN